MKEFIIKIKPDMMATLGKRGEGELEKKAGRTTPAKGDYDSPASRKERLSKLPARLFALIRRALILQEKGKLTASQPRETMEALYSLQEEINNLSQASNAIPTPLEKLKTIEDRITTFEQEFNFLDKGGE